MNKKLKNNRQNPGEEDNWDYGLKDGHPHSKNLREITEREIAIAEKNMINKVLNRTNGNKKKAADLLQTSYKSILNKIKLYGL